MSTTLKQTRIPWTYTFGLVLAFLATFGSWYDPASLLRVGAWHFGVWQSCDIPFPSFKLFSYGALVTLVVFFGWRWRRAGNVQGMYAMAATLVFIAVAFFIQIGFTRASWVDAAVRGAVDFHTTLSFIGNLNAPLSYDSAPDAGIAVPQEGLTARFWSTRDCLTYGWIIFLGASLLSFFTAGRMLPHNEATRRTKRWLVLIFAVILALQLMPAFMGQAYAVRGDRAAAMDRPEVAEAAYRHAMAWDEWYCLEPTLFLRIGELRQSRGDRTSPTARLYLAEQNAANGSYLLAMDLLEKADVSKDPVMARVLRVEIGDLALAQGTADYRLGQIGAARFEWERAAQAEPAQVAAYCMLGQAATNLSNYPEAEAWYAQGFHWSGIPTTKAICLAGTGDAYYLRGQTGKARGFYLRSLEAFFDDNYRAVKSLIQDYYQ